MIRIYLNSVADSDTPINAPSLWLEATANCQGIEDLELTFNRKDDVAQRAISNQLEFYDGSYDLLYEKLVTDKAEHVWVKIEVDGFGYTFPYLQIRWNAIEWCSDRCSMSANLTTWNTDIDAYRTLRNTLIWDDELLDNLNYDNPFTGNTEQAHPLMRVKLSSKGAAKQWDFGLIGVFIRHYFYNLCYKANLTPSSSIFSYTGLNAWSGDDYDDHNWTSASDRGYDNDKDGRNPYHLAAVFLNKDFGQGDDIPNAFLTGQATRPRPRNISNALNLNGIQFLSDFGQVFNAKYRIKNGLLEFERKDYFFQSQNVWVDLSNKKQCLKLKPQDNWSYLRLEYGQESELWETALPEFSQFIANANIIQFYPPSPQLAEKYYNEIAEWNSPPSTRQEGEKTSILPFAKLRTVNNGVIKTTTTSGYDIDKFAFNCWNLGADTPFLSCVREDTPMNRMTPYISADETGGALSTSLEINRPFYTKKSGTLRDDVTGEEGLERLWKGTLYDNFHFIDDPRRRPNNRGYYAKEPYKSFEYTITTDFDCDMLNNFDIDSVIETQQGTASMEEVVFNFKNLEVEIKGFV